MKNYVEYIQKLPLPRLPKQYDAQS